MPNTTRDLFGSTPWLNAPWHDALTGSLTRQHFVDLLVEECQHARETGLPFILFIADLDGLRAINERAGIRTGDAVLVAASERMRELLARHPWHNLDSCYSRFGDDSFALLARECDLDHGHRLAEAYRRRIAAGPVADSGLVTVSIGVAQYQPGESVDALVSRAERTLHLAKQFGPDRVEVAPLSHAPVARSNVIPLRPRMMARG
jgi:diguanylate cyclase (GGDEF)-like protein